MIMISKEKQEPLNDKITVLYTNKSTLSIIHIRFSTLK